MRRRWALAVLGLLAAAAATATLLAGRGGPLVGSWETAVALEGGQTVTLRYTFDPDGTYTCALSGQDRSLDSGARVRGNYKALSGRLYLSEGLDYAIDPAIYDHYRLERGTLTLLDSSAGDLMGVYPLILTRTEE